MDLSRIFMKNATPTKIGGQAIMEGIMMRGKDRTATVVRLPDDSLHIKTDKLPPKSKWAKIPIIRGVVAFVGSLVMGTKILMYSADVLEAYETGNPAEEPDKFELWMQKKFGKEKAWAFMIYLSVVVALLFTVGIFILLPTAAVHWCTVFTQNEFALNLIEGFVRILLFVGYVAAIRKMKEIRRVFGFHGAEHKCIHAFENGIELTPANCQQFYTLHPRCGTSFLMFVMVISILLFSCLGWPSLFYRVLSRLLLIPVVAGLSYELLQWAGRSDNWLVKILSLPGIFLQKLTTCEPDEKQLEVAIAAMKAVLVDESEPTYEGTCDLEGKLIKSETLEEMRAAHKAVENGAESSAENDAEDEKTEVEEAVETKEAEDNNQQ